MKKQLIFGVLIPIILGGLLYIGFRSESLVMFSWFEILHINWGTSAFRTLFTGFDMKLLPNWVVFSLPGGLYMMSCVSLMMLLWSNTFNSKSFFWILLVPILGILSEPLQYNGLLPGTYHLDDYFFYIIFTIIPVILFRKNKTKTLKTAENSSNKTYFLSGLTILFYFMLAFGADVVGSPLGNLVEKVMGPYWAGNI